uniref:Uncharacterized protein n=1 Tax=Anguilla anguilla TaxID=7936 RepID=A0A0E9VZY0_ANGAN
MQIFHKPPNPSEIMPTEGQAFSSWSQACI